MDEETKRLFEMVLEIKIEQLESKIAPGSEAVVWDLL